MPGSSVTFAIDIPADELSAIFSFDPAVRRGKAFLPAAAVPGSSQPSHAHDPLPGAIGHALNQSLLRDGFYGAWGQVWKGKDGRYHASLSSPVVDPDLEDYATAFPAFLAAVKHGHDLYEKYVVGRKPRPADAPDLPFVPPFGLPMVHVKSVQVLHYPPLGTLSYMDYLYSATNRRWENLLGQNGYTGSDDALVERIVDTVPIAADGGDAGAKVIEAYGQRFGSYVKQMLRVFLRPTASGKATQPVVVLGSPASQLLTTELRTGPLHPGDLAVVKLLGRSVSTPVLAANHPAVFMYYKPTDPPAKLAEARKVLVQDLVCAGWQTEMSQDPDADPAEVLASVQGWWTPRTKLVEDIFQQQLTEFTY